MTEVLFARKDDVDAEAAIEAKEAAEDAQAAAEAAQTAAESAEAGAETAEANAVASATAAAGSATSAASSATAAQTAQTAAETAQAAAEAAQTAAETAQAEAADAETNAAGSAAAAASSATSAAGSASSASSSASSASMSATSAASSATSAATSATNAANSATAAATAQSAAEDAQAAAESALDEFTDLYLGAKASDPSTDNDGNALQDGALYINTGSDLLKFYSNSSWHNVPAPTFLALTDTPSAFSSQALKIVRVNAGEDALEFGPVLGTMAEEDAADYYTSAEIDAAFQPLDGDLTAIAALSTTSFGRGLLELADATALAALVDSFFLTPAEGDAAYQPLDSDLTAIAALSTAPFGRGLLTYASEAAFKAGVNLEIGVDVQAYDADTLFADVGDTLTAGFLSDSYAGGTVSSGTYTPAPQTGQENIQHITNGGAFTLAPPASPCTVVLQITNNSSAGTITTSGFTKVIGDDFTTTDGDDFMCFIVKTNDFSLLNVVALQ